MMSLAIKRAQKEEGRSSGGDGSGGDGSGGDGSDDDSGSSLVFFLSSLTQKPPSLVSSPVSTPPPPPQTGLPEEPCGQKRTPPPRTPNKTNKMGHADVWNSHNNDHSKGGRTCRVCGNHWGLVRKYGVNMCRQCFRAAAPSLGFVKYR